MVSNGRFELRIDASSGRRISKHPPIIIQLTGVCARPRRAAKEPSAGSIERLRDAVSPLFTCVIIA